MERCDAERPTYGFTVAAAVDAVPSARRRVTALAQNLGARLSDEMLETVELLASEVIANAVLHSAAPCDVIVTRAGDRLRVEVTDTDPSLSSAVEAGPNDESGRGLLLVDALADAWGMRPEPAGKTAWFEIALDPSIDGLDHNSAEGLSSPRMGADAAPRTDCQTRMDSPASSRTSFVPANAGQRHRAA
ncbi:ATP-binding protein [Streptomyces sp. NPDC051985]|uniref:ATP-binding protein n=1 Tax=Streptomyces sp. NPDC051985 TaxID=3155807 RepID=UPI00341F6D31